MNSPRGVYGIVCGMRTNRGDLPAQKGFVKLVLLIVIALVVLGFFGYNLRDIVNSPTVHDNLAYVWDLVVKFWDTFLATPFHWFWDKFQMVFENNAPQE